MFYTYQQFETLKIQNQFEVQCIILMAYSVTLVMKDWNPPDLGVIN